MSELGVELVFRSNCDAGKQVLGGLRIGVIGQGPWQGSLCDKLIAGFRQTAQLVRGWQYTIVIVRSIPIITSC